MLRAVFIGSKNEFDQMLVHWLAQRTELVGVVWTRSTAWRRSWRGRLDFARTRIRRYGLLKATDELLFHLHYHTFVNRKDLARLHREVIEPYQARHGTPRWKGRPIFATDVNAPEVRAYLEQRQPDVALAMCINNYFGRELRSIPRLGVFLWHEGITPEYRGLYSPFWAVSNLDFDRIGYTLFRMNDEYDAGEVFVQGRAVDVDPMRQGAPYLGHKAIADSLPAVEQFLLELEAGRARPIDRSAARPRSYTYPGLSDLVRQRVRLLRWRRACRRQRTGPSTCPEPGATARGGGRDSASPNLVSSGRPGGTRDR